MRLIAIEEHFITEAVLAAWERQDPSWSDFAQRAANDPVFKPRLSAFDGSRLGAMDASGVDVQVISLSPPGLQNLEPDEAVALQGPTNDWLAGSMAAHGDRFQGFAILATPHPERAAQELERAITTLGFNGAMLYGSSRGLPLDHKSFLPIFEAAEALNAPIHLHPQVPPAAVSAAYYDGFSPAVSDALSTHRLGWHIEAGITFARLVAAGHFDRFPDLQLILGHWGEVVLFFAERLIPLQPIARLKRSIPEILKTNVHVAPSGMLSQRYLRWAIETVGANRILFSTDYPYENAGSAGARAFLDGCALSDTERSAIAHGNWERLVAAIRR